MELGKGENQEGKIQLPGEYNAMHAGAIGFGKMREVKEQQKGEKRKREEEKEENEAETVKR